jgi:uncharacterized protein
VLQGLLDRTAVQKVVTLAISACGGFAAELIGMPAGWIAGGILAVAVASLAGYNTRFPPRLLAPLMLILGIYAGSGVNEDTLQQMRTWPASFAILFASVVLLVTAGYWWLHTRCGWQRNDAVLSVLPGALTFVIAVAEDLKADMKKIAITQSIRLLAMIEAIPLMALVVGHPTDAALAVERQIAGPVTLAVLIAAGTAAALAMNALRLPGGWIVGGLLATGALHLAGFVEGRVPDFLTVPCQIGLGAMAGSRFRPGDLALLPRIAAPALGALLITSTISAAAALSVTLMFGISFIQTLLAFAPGAQEALTVLAFQMNVDPAYVAAHHVVRFVGLVAAVPLLAGWLARRP